MLLHLSAQGTDFAVLLLNNAVQTLAFLTQHRDFALGLRPQFFVGVVGLLQSAFQCIALVAHGFEFALQFAEGACGKTEVLLSAAHLFVETVVFAHEFLDALFVGFGLLRGGAEAVAEVIDFGADL